MKVIQKRVVRTKFDIYGFFKRTWWRLFQQRIMPTKLDIYVCKYNHWVETSAGITCPVVSASALAWFIRYIYACNLQLLNIVFFKTKFNLPQT